MPLRDATVAFLAPKRLLLVLDNLEQIRPAEALGREVAALLAKAPGLTILATSRAALRIRAERERPVDPLPTPDPARLLPPPVLAANPAVALFLERARAARSGLALTEANAAAVATIVHRLDGLPLALELAAARLRALSPIQLRDRLGTQLDLLFGPSGDRPDRQQTLRATIRWSHDLLSPDEKVLFRRLAVFAGSFSLDAAEGVVEGAQRPASPPPPERSDAPSVLVGIEELLAQSLLRAEETPTGELRYRMLETIRAYARERLAESGEEEAARAAHLAFFAAWAEDACPDLVGPDRAACLDRLETEEPNLRAALGWALDHGRAAEGLALAGDLWKFWHYRSRLAEGRSWLQRLLDATPDEATEERTVAYEASGVLAWHQGDLAAAEALLNRALALAQERGDRAGQGRSLNNLGNVRNMMGDLDGAAAFFAESLELARTAGNLRQEATILNNLALIAMDRGDLAAAEVQLERSLALKRELGARAETAIVFGNLALIAWLRRDIERAIPLLEEALAIERENDSPVGIADALGNLAAVLSEAGQLQRAVALHRESLAIRHEVGDWLSLPYSLESIAAAAVGAGRAAAAVRLLGASEALREATSAPIPETDRAAHEETVKQARVALEDEVFAALWAEGRGLDREATVEAALALCDGLAAGGEQEGAPVPPIDVSAAAARR